MEYQKILSKFGKESIYVPAEKMLYVSKGRTGEFICYQTVLADRKKKGHENHIKCSARIRCLPNGTCKRQNEYVQHTSHPNHERIVSDKQVMRNIVTKAEELRTNYVDDAGRMPNRHIFQREVARYSTKLRCSAYRQIWLSFSKFSCNFIYCIMYMHMHIELE